MKSSFSYVSVSAASAITIIAVGFMLEKLFFEQWPWWVWAIIALLSALAALWISLHIPNLEQRKAKLPADAEFRLQRIREITSFLDKNMMWFYLMIVIGIPTVIRSCEISEGPPDEEIIIEQPVP